ncbi:transposase [Chroococcidiopsis cubana]
MQANHCSWRMLPAHFPCWQTVSSYLYRWRRQGVWETICEAIRTDEV